MIRRLYGLLRPYRRTVVAGLACLTLSVCAELAPPLVWKYVIDVGERGAKLSGGQKQRLAIARALIAAPRILLLDEPTSAVDPESEGMIVDALARLPHSLTTIIVTHRLSLARSADRVVVLVDGRVVEDGAPAELLTRPEGHFASMSREEWALAASAG